VRRLLRASKVGHGGTLDPRASGVLPVLLGRATRAAAALIGCDKAYEGLMILHGDVPDEALREAMGGFVGVVRQLPPRRSRVKREARDRCVREFRLVGREGREVRFSVRCQGGTYIRKLVHDLGVRLGCGAHMRELRRTAAGPFGLDEAVTLEDVRAAAAALRAGDPGPLRVLLMQVEVVLERLLPVVVADDGAVEPICGGALLAVPGVCALDDFAAGQTVLVLTLKGELIGLGEALMGSEEILDLSHGHAVAVRWVLMPRGTYPRGPVGAA
jgi:H/ACA ribonucleoprotein complex subunit 4